MAIGFSCFSGNPFVLPLIIEKGCRKGIFFFLVGITQKLPPFGSFENALNYVVQKLEVLMVKELKLSL